MPQEEQNSRKDVSPKSTTLKREGSGGSERRTIRLQMQDETDDSDPSYIYSCSIGHILEHEFCHLGCRAVKGKFLKQRNFCLSMLLFEVFFSTFWWQKQIFFFRNILASALKSYIIILL